MFEDPREWTAYSTASLSPWDKDYCDVVELRKLTRDRQLQRVRQHNEERQVRAMELAKVAAWSFGNSV